MRMRVVVLSPLSVSVCEGLLCVALWGSLGNDLLAHCLTSFVPDVTSSGRPSLISPSDLATNPTILSPLARLRLFFIALITA